jgi:hypothetical protein
MIKIVPIIPKSLLRDVQDIERDIAHALDTTIIAVQTDFESTTGTWKHNVHFTLGRPSPYERECATNDAIYGYVDGGTKPHLIRPRRARRLRFKTGYRAKTTPGVIGSTGGGASGPVVYARAVRHPGTKARKFADAIAKKAEKMLLAELDKAMKDI